MFLKRKKVTMKELKVGERVTITLEVVEENGCEGCFFYGKYRCLAPSKSKCSNVVRSDGKDIVFKEVKE